MDSTETEDRPPEELPDATLGGYVQSHQRPPAFEGADGYPYTVSIEIDRTPELRAPYVTYLVFPRWAYTGLGLIGHLQSPVLARSMTEDAALDVAESLTLHEIKAILDETIAREEETDGTEETGAGSDAEGWPEGGE